MNIKTTDAAAASQVNLSQTLEPRDVSRAGVSESSSPGSAPAVDSIALSNTSDLVQLALQSGTDARAARVQELRQQIQNNQYQVDPLTVSRSLISAHLAGE